MNAQNIMRNNTPQLCCGVFYRGYFLKGNLKLGKQLPIAAGDRYIIYSGNKKMKAGGIQPLKFKHCGRVMPVRRGN